MTTHRANIAFKRDGRYRALSSLAKLGVRHRPRAVLKAMQPGYL